MLLYLILMIGRQCTLIFKLTTQNWNCWTYILIYYALFSISKMEKTQYAGSTSSYLVHFQYINYKQNNFNNHSLIFLT